MPAWLAFLLGLLTTPALFAVTVVVLHMLEEFRDRKSIKALRETILERVKRDEQFADEVAGALKIKTDARKAPN